MSGSYQVLGNPEAALEVSHGIISSAIASGADAMATMAFFMKLERGGHFVPSIL